MPFPFALAASLLPAIYQGAKGLVQKSQAKNLKESTFIPEELRMNQGLANQQAYSRRAPGAANSESLIRRVQANQNAAAARNFGGDAAKMAAVGGAAAAQADDANAKVAAQGQQFSENAFGRVAQANSAVAGQKRQNRDEYNRAKESLLYSSDQNIFNGINNAASAGLAGYLNGDFSGDPQAKMARLTARRDGLEDTPENAQKIAALNKRIAGTSAMPPTRSYNAWADYQGVQSMQNNGYNPYNYNQQQYQDNGVWRQPGYSQPRYNLNVAPRMNRNFRR